MNKGTLILSTAIVSLVIIFAILIIRPFTGEQPGSPAASLEEEEQAVYSAVMQDMDGSGREGSAVLLFEETRHVDGSVTEGQEEDLGWLNLQFNMPKLSREAYDNYLAQNDRPYPLSPDMELSIKYYLIGSEELGEIFENYSVDLAEAEDSIVADAAPYLEMSRRYPGTSGLYSISRVGFNPEMTEALVYFDYGCGSLCGEGYYVRLEKENGVWKIVDKWQSWIS